MEQWITGYIKQMTLDEKIGMIHGCALFKNKGVERLGIPPLVMSDGTCGIRFDHKDSAWEETNEGICECSWLPSGSALASTWNTKLAHDVGTVLGEETRGRGKDVILAPGINIQRTPLCGRNFEYMSEDPHLTSQIASHEIQGIQECDVAVCVKHFALNNQEFERTSVDVDVDERTLHEIYLPAFKAAITQGKAYSFMCSYNKLFGRYASESNLLLNEILKSKWNFDGVVISDWGAVHNAVESAYNGIDLDMGVSTDFDNYPFAAPLKKAVEDGRVPEEILDDKIARILLLQKRLNILGGRPRKRGEYNTGKHHEILHNASQEAVVLLKNEDDILPLKPDNIRKVAIIGDAASRRIAHGGGSAEVKALFEITPLLGISMLLGGNAEVKYAKGYYVDNEAHTCGEVNWQASSLDTAVADSETQSDDPHAITAAASEIAKKQELLRMEALQLASECDTVIYVGGLNRAYDTEGFDRSSYELPYAQDRLINELLDIKPDMVISILSGSAVNMSSFASKAKAILWNSLNGMHSGLALSEIIFGSVNPSGKLPISFPVRLEDCPAHSIGEYPGTIDENELRTCHYREGIYVGYRHYSTRGVEPLFCFGHGLSYSSFEYSNLNIRLNPNKDLATDNFVIVKFKITNKSSLFGKETAQVYISPINPQIERPSMELKAFIKIGIQPDETSNITLALKESDFTYYSVRESAFVFDSGKYAICICSSSKDIRLTQIITV